MEHDSNYIKDVENYFLSLAGEGIMLSSMDYSLILEWKNKEIPKEVVFKGINKAFQEWKAKEGQGTKSARNLKRCAQYIERSILEHSPIIATQGDLAENSDSSGEIEVILSTLNSYIKSENDDTLKDYYSTMKEKLLSAVKSADETPVALSARIEQECVSDFFDSLPEKEKEAITMEAQSMLGTRARHMTKEAIEESTVSFRNEILANNYGLKSLLPDEDYNG